MAKSNRKPKGEGRSLPPAESITEIKELPPASDGRSESSPERARPQFTEIPVPLSQASGRWKDYAAAIDKFDAALVKNPETAMLRIVRAFVPGDVPAFYVSAHAGFAVEQSDIFYLRLSSGAYVQPTE